TWVSNSVNKIMPPGGSEYKNSFGAIAYADSFDTNFIASLLPTTNYNGTNAFMLYSVEVVETTNSNGRIRNYYSATSTNLLVLYSSIVSQVNYPVSWITDVYGDAPSWLSGDDLQGWYDDRDPMRQHVLCDLISTNSIPDYMAMLTNSIGYYVDGTNTNSMLSVYSNDIALVQYSNLAGDADFYLHAPADIPMLDVYKSTNLLDQYGWKLVATIEHNLDPLRYIVPFDATAMFSIGDAVTDSDGDGISDARELKMFGTDRYLADTDGDGLNDGEEILNYGLNALSSDSDNDGLNDVTEMQYYKSKVVVWGDDSNNQIDMPAELYDVKDIASGGMHCMALQEGRTVVAWGNNTYGQCNVPASVNNVSVMSAGDSHSLVLKYDATMVAWGNNTYGQCNIPTSGILIYMDVSAGARHSLAVRWDKTVLAWGDNTYGQCDVPLGLWGDAVAVSAGVSHSVALRSDATVVAWGANTYGQCDVPSGLGNVTAISAGGTHTLALREDKTVVAWGMNSFGQCDIPSGLNQIVSISAGATYSMALCQDGTVFAWGANTYGQCDVPSSLTAVTAISAGANRSLALTTFRINPSVFDTDGDALGDGWEVQYNLDPNDPYYANGATGDPDNDELINVEEQHAGTDPTNWDTDGELLPDGWEVMYGLNPLVADNLSSDTDGDGLNLFDEYRYVTRPNDTDTDDDGVTDGDEVLRSPRSNPNNASDGGNPTNCVTIKLTVGDPSGSNSERWSFDIFDGNNATVHHVDDDFGVPGSAEYALVKGNEYTFKINWIATDPEYENYPEADYDWQALINDSASNGVRQGLYDTGAFIVEDPDALLTSVTHGDAENLTIGKEGKIIIVPTVSIMEVGFSGAGEHIIKKTGTDTWTNDTYASSGDVVISDPVWKDANLDGDITDAEDKDDPICFTRSSSPIIEAKFKVPNSLTINNVPFRAYLKVSPTYTLNYNANVNISGDDVTVIFMTTNKLPEKVHNGVWDISFECDILGILDIDAGSSMHMAFTTFDTPKTTYFDIGNNYNSVLMSLTAKRIDIATKWADGYSTTNDIATAADSGVNSMFGFDVSHYTNNPFAALDIVTGWDCITWANIAATSCRLLGVEAHSYRAWCRNTIMTNDSSTWGWEPQYHIYRYPGSGETPWFLGYPQNNFQGFFYVGNLNIAEGIFPLDGWSVGVHKTSVSEKEKYLPIYMLESFAGIGGEVDWHVIGGGMAYPVEWEPGNLISGITVDLFPVWYIDDPIHDGTYDLSWDASALTLQFNTGSNVVVGASGDYELSSPIGAIMVTVATNSLPSYDVTGKVRFVMPHDLVLIP
ncbi:MAG: hypothetical protein KAI74_06405, partial [Kiritimatiellae bacterium]|nr:hypothetical protein [Kiritimatiellia bacterium]